MKAYFIIIVFSLSIINTQGQEDVRMYIFGHSLINHEFEVNPPVPGDETSVPHWVGDMVASSSHSYSADGQYGFLPTHLNLPPTAQWYFDLAPGVWDSDLEPFSDADFNFIMITPANFIQWLPPDGFPYNDLPTTSPVDATATIFNWTLAQEDNLHLMIYENWPDMGSIAPTWPATPAQFETYNNLVVGSHHDWFISYQDMVRSAMSDNQISMVPVGPIIAELFMNNIIPAMPIGEIYQDNAPHGRASIYFLAGLITYMAIYEEQPPSSYTIPTIVHDNIRDNFDAISNYAWNYLQNFTDTSGQSRVFTSASTLPIDRIDLVGKNVDGKVQLEWTTINAYDVDYYEIQKFTGASWKRLGRVKAGASSASATYFFTDASPDDGWNIYRIRVVDFDKKETFSDSIHVESAGFKDLIYPNPTSSSISISSHFKYASIYDLHGQLLYDDRVSETIDLTGWKTGMYIVRLDDGKGSIYREKLIIH